LFNNVACEAYFSDAGALQLVIDQHALLSVFGRYTERPASYFRELGDAVKLLNLPQSQAEFVRQVRLGGGGGGAGSVRAVAGVVWASQQALAALGGCAHSRRARGVAVVSFSVASPAP
jgi:hypothetical protein